METTEATEWTPAEDFNTGLTADDWKEILEDKYFQDNKPIGLITLWLYYKYNAPCSYTELAKEYGRSIGYYIGGMTQFNTTIADKFKEKIHPFTDEKGKMVYWYLPFVARKVSKENGEDWSFIFKLRDEVREGFDKLSEERRQEFEQMYQKGLMKNKNNVELNSKEKECLEKLQKSRQIILTGAPGTGKSYAAHEIANELTGNKAENIEFVQFHPSMDYTDFVEGLRPIKDDKGQIGFERRDGLFKAFCKRALKNQENFVFIIDEINRGDISKIFGELFFAIDPSYRGKKGKITTQYQNLVESDDLYAGGFYIPENVYIIGTMNDIDRGVESMDFAIRRRFTWIEVNPDDTQSMLDSGIPEYAADAKERMGALNKVIFTNPSLGKAYQIGAAYFLRLNELNGDFDALWAYHLEPLLREYLRGDPRAEEFLDEMKKAYGVEVE